MGRQPFRYRRIAALLAGLMPCAAPVCADESALPGVSAAAPAIVLARLSTDPRTPEGYSAQLELHVKLHSFPFVGLTVHGTSTERKPGLYHYQLQNLPRVAAKFDDLHYDLGGPSSWTARYDIDMAPG